MVLGAVAVFAFTVRSLGLVVAGPLCFIVASLADRDTRPVEAVVSAVIATLACGFLFKDLLNLPIPFDPVSILGPLHAPYDALKTGRQVASSWAPADAEAETRRWPTSSTTWRWGWRSRCRSRTWRSASSAA